MDAQMEANPVPKTGHTPGPWTLEDWNYRDSRGHVPVVCTAVDAIAEAYGLWNSSRDRRDEQIANARLIAAAPDLAEALVYMVAIAEAEGWSGLMLADGIAALRKAGLLD